jgi:hypothetical protein
VIESTIPADRVLLVILGEGVTLKVAERLPASTVQIGEDQFHSPAASEWIGFYDWLRTADDELIGVRQWIDEEFSQVCEGLVRFDSVYMPTSNYAEIYFDSRRAFDAENSDSQSFGGNRIYVSQRSNYMLTFALHWLEDRDRAYLEQISTQVLTDKS